MVIITANYTHNDTKANRVMQDKSHYTQVVYVHKSAGFVLASYIYIYEPMCRLVN